MVSPNVHNAYPEKILSSHIFKSKYHILNNFYSVNFFLNGMLA